MFTLNLTPLFWAAVYFDMPAADSPGRVTCSFQAQFPRMTTDELEAFGKEAEAGKWTDRQCAARLLRGWGEDLRDQNGNALPFSEANLAQVLNTAGVGAAVVYAFRAAQPQASLGN